MLCWLIIITLSCYRQFLPVYFCVWMVHCDSCHHAMLQIVSSCACMVHCDPYHIVCMLQWSSSPYHFTVSSCTCMVHCDMYHLITLQFRPVHAWSTVILITVSHCISSSCVCMVHCVPHHLITLQFLPVLAWSTVIHIILSHYRVSSYVCMVHCHTEILNSSSSPCHVTDSFFLCMPGPLSSLSPCLFTGLFSDFGTPQSVVAEDCSCCPLSDWSVFTWV